MDFSPAKPSTALRFLIWIAIIPSLIGEFFKIMHWPGAGILMIFGTFIFAFIYLPLYSIECWKTKTGWKAKLLLALQLFVVFLFAIGFLFKIQHWPGGGFFYFLNNYILFFLVLPYSLYHLAKSAKHSLNKAHGLFVLIYFFSHSFSALLNSNTGKINIDAVLQQGIHIEESFKTANSRNKQLYNTLDKLNLQPNSEIALKAESLKRMVDHTINHIKEVKSHLLVVIDEIPKTQADTLPALFIENKVDYDKTTWILLMNENKATPGPYSASKLKDIIKNCHDSLLGFVQEQNRPIISEGLNLSTDNYEGEGGEPISWEQANFDHMPLSYVFNTLTNIQYEIKNAEFQVLTDIINSGNKELNTSLVSQIAELNSKYDAAKKTAEITSLQKENEKGVKLLNEKNIELDDTRQTIVFFVMIILVFIILVFFVIRSNVLRKKANKILLQQKEIIENQKTEVENQKHLVEEKQKEIIDSISYAKRLQEAILPPQKFIDEHAPNNFILYRPKDLVAGDFYWAERIGDLFFIAAADSTGHGVPGAMVSVVCSNALNRTVKEFGLTNTGKILDKTRELVLETFAKSTDDVKDGMDISLLCIDKKQNKLFWSGANNPLWYIHDKKIITIKPDKQPIGKTENPQPFISHEIELIPDTTFYLFTDGYADQFGGEKGKKFKYKQFEELLLSINDKALKQQSDILNQKFEDWKGDLEQVDDICIIGIKL